MWQRGRATGSVGPPSEERDQRKRKRGGGGKEDDADARLTLGNYDRRERVVEDSSRETENPRAGARPSTSVSARGGLGGVVGGEHVQRMATQALS